MRKEGNINQKVNCCTKRKIVPFKEFWLDCYSTMLYSIYQMGYSDKMYLYNNAYVYDILKAGKKCIYPFQTITFNMNFNYLKNIILKNKKEFELKGKKDIDKLKQYINNNLIIFLGVDLYYCIPESVHWKKNHIQHYTLVTDYNKETNEFTVLDTGKHGYEEFVISSKEIKRAAKHYKGMSVTYELIERKDKFIAFEELDVVANANKIVISIEKVLQEIEQIWNVEKYKESELKYFVDFVQTHLYALENRQKVNAFLMQEILKCSSEIEKELKILINKFHDLEEGYCNLKLTLLTCYDLQALKNKIMSGKNIFSKLLKIEAEIWRKFIKIEQNLL